MTTSPAGKKPKRSVSEAIGRLYALWVISSCGLLLLIVIVSVLANNQTRSILAELSRRQDAIARLQGDLRKTEKRVEALEAALRKQSRIVPRKTPVAGSAARPATGAPRPADPVATAAGILDNIEQRLARGDRRGAARQLDTLGDGATLPLALRLRIGRALVMLDRWDELDRLLEQVSTAPAPTLESLNFLRAAADVHAGRLAEAVGILDHLLVKHPDDYELLLWRGIALLQADRPQLARATLDRATKHVRRPEAWYWRGVVELRADNAVGAAVFFHKALAAAPGYAPALEGLAIASLEQGDPAAAARNLQRVLKSEPDRAEAHFLLARTLATQHQRDAAARELRRALQLDPEFISRARQAPELTAMFSESQLQAMASPRTPAVPATAGERP